MTNYEYLMGTPALAAQFVAKVTRNCSGTGDGGCGFCPLAGIDCSDYQELREWLESEMD